MVSECVPLVATGKPGKKRATPALASAPEQQWIKTAVAGVVRSTKVSVTWRVIAVESRVKIASPVAAEVTGGTSLAPSWVAVNVVLSALAREAENAKATNKAPQSSLLMEVSFQNAYV
jgi:hypothetical protein